jgi:hypothetical protein
MQKITETDIGCIFKAETIEEASFMINGVSDLVGPITHFGVPYNKNTFKSYFSNPTRFKNSFGYCFIDKKNQPLGGIVWIKDFDYSTKSKILREFIWISKEPKISLKLFKDSINDVSKNYQFDIIVSGNSENNVRLEKFYKRQGFKKANYFFKKLNANQE